MIKIKNFFIKEGKMDHKNVLIILLVISLLLSFWIIKEKSKFEISYNEEYYKSFHNKFLTFLYDKEGDKVINSTFGILLNRVERALKGDSLEEYEIYSIDDMINDLEYFESDISSHYYEFYNEKLDYDRVIIRDFISKTRLWKPNFKEVGPEKYILKEDVIKKLSDYYMLEKIKSLTEVLKSNAYNTKGYYEEIKAGNGKNFIKDKKWQSLFLEIQNAIVNVDKEYNYGKHSPDKVVFSDYPSVPREVDDLSIHFPNSGTFYRVAVHDWGVYFFIYRDGKVENLNITSINKENNTISIIVNKGKFEYQHGTRTYIRGLLRGIDPYNVKNLEFKIIDENGDEIKGSIIDLLNKEE